MNKCFWMENVDGEWETGCNESFILLDGTPYENKMKYCCYCGKILVQVPYNMGLGSNDNDDESN